MANKSTKANMLKSRVGMTATRGTPGRAEWTVNKTVEKNEHVLEYQGLDEPDWLQKQ